MFRILLMNKGYKQTLSMSLFHRVAYTICFSFHVQFEMLYPAMLLTVDTNKIKLKASIAEVQTELQAKKKKVRHSETKHS
jgi:hypothetical protein